MTASLSYGVAPNVAFTVRPLLQPPYWLGFSTRSLAKTSPHTTQPDHSQMRSLASWACLPFRKTSFGSSKPCCQGVFTSPKPSGVPRRVLFQSRSNSQRRIWSRDGLATRPDGSSIICLTYTAVPLRCYLLHPAHTRYPLPLRCPAGCYIHQRSQSLLAPLLSLGGCGMAFLHGNEYRAFTWRLMSASLLLLRAVLCHICTAAEYRASAWCLSSALLLLLPAVVTGMFARKLRTAPPAGTQLSTWLSLVLTLV